MIRLIPILVLLLAVALSATRARTAALLTPCEEQAIIRTLTSNPGTNHVRRLTKSHEKALRRLFRSAQFVDRLLWIALPPARLFPQSLSRILSQMWLPDRS
ncbi:MAG: hypothetical protein M3R68_09100 [Acidobacteriota bacterium]|nr:hypothetical protein [Acidobacteriota bacterium]